jgi:hypothetical protein
MRAAHRGVFDHRNRRVDAAEDLVPELAGRMQFVYIYGSLGERGDWVDEERAGGAGGHEGAAVESHHLILICGGLGKRALPMP